MSAMSQSEYSCDCGATFNSQEELDEHYQNEGPK